MTATVRERFAAWIERYIVADDPNPEYSRLDRLDGLTQTPTAPDGLSWPVGAITLVAALDAEGITNDLGLPFAHRTVDLAIQSAAEKWCESEGVPMRAAMPDFEPGSGRWRAILPDVLESLGLDPDALEV